jgi:exodeoxyribonuclease V alpha subunit
VAITTTLETNIAKDTKTDNFNFLDKQLADLLLRLCVDAGYTPDATRKAQLTELARRTSAATREGIIALPLTDAAFAYTPDDLLALQELPVIGKAGDYKPLIIEDGHIWLNRYWHYEHRLATSLQQRLTTLSLSPPQCKAIRERLQDWHYQYDQRGQSLQVSETDWQQQAVAMAAYSRFLIISGGPGTGKTTTVMRLLWLLIEQMQVNPQRILLAAPTGKAAMRLQESIRQAKTALHIPAELSGQIPEQAATLHRLLGYIPGRVSFRHHLHNRLPADVVIVDEASMIDIALMTHLFEAVPGNARLILLGDRDQLAAVETGSIFRDLCAQADNHYSAQRQHQLDYLCAHRTAEANEDKEVTFAGGSQQALNDHIVVLQKSWRFAAESGIGQLASAVRDADTEKLRDILQTDWPDVQHHDTSILDMAQLETAWQEYLQQICQPVAAGQPAQQQLATLFSAFNRFRILTPLRKGQSGTGQLNQRISQFIQHRYASAPLSGHPWFAGRPVMVTQNDYRQNLFNGDIGLTLADSSGQLRVWFPEADGFRAIAPIRLPAHETGWAMTIHKSQGSEFDEVLLILPENEDIPILGRELLYTGITRAKQKIAILGQLRVIHHAMQKTLPPSSRIYYRLAQNSSAV